MRHKTLTTQNKNQLLIEIAHQTTKTPTPTPRKAQTCAHTFIVSMLATTIHKSNTTPHNQDGATTTHPQHGDDGPVVSKPISVPDDFFNAHCCAPERDPLQAGPLNCPNRVTLTQREARGNHWCSLERR